MKLIEREHIDLDRWNKLISASSDDFFSYSWYVDALADNWCVIVDENYTKGMAIPFTQKMGVRLAYIPVFSRYTEWIGGEVDLELISLINERFKGFDWRLKQQLGLESEKVIVYQEIRPDQEINAGSQAKRMLKKAEKANYEVQQSESTELAFKLIELELKGKFQGVDQQAIDRLKLLCNSAATNGVLKVFSVDNIGSIICLVSDRKLLYLKGTATEEGKKNGAMYLLMNEAIRFSKNEKLIFDFGGSNVEGVKNFNHNLGGTDVYYYAYHSDKAPFWYKFLRKLKHRGNY